MLSSVGTNKGARRAALVHLSFNVIGTIVWVVIFWIIKATLAPAILAIAADELNIAIVHSAFNVLCTALLLPMTGLLEKIAYILIPEDRAPEVVEELDERLLTTPAVALERCHAVAADMAHCAVDTLHKAIAGLYAYTPELEAEVRAGENRSDHYEDILGSYLVKLSALQISDNASAEAAMLLKIIGDFERISDHGVEIIASAQEIRQKNLSFSPAGEIEIRKITAAVEEILDLALAAFIKNDSDAIFNVEPLEQIIDELKNTLRSNHIKRLQQGECTIDVGFVWSDLLTSLERTSDHCSNIAGGVLDFANHNMNMHENLHALKADNTAFDQRVMQYREKYALKA